MVCRKYSIGTSHDDDDDSDDDLLLKMSLLLSV